jgi:hypothetical protein
MTNTRPDLSLSRIELVILARMSVAKPPGEQELAKQVADLAMHNDPPAHAREAVAHALAALRRRGLVSTHQRIATDDGNRALRAAFELPQTPTWTAVRNSHLAARALGLPPGTPQTQKTVKDAKTMALPILRAHFKLPAGATLTAICDVLIAEALHLPAGPVTIARIRAHVLAQHAGGTATGTPERMATQLAAKTLKASPADKRTMGRALGRRWLYEALPAGDSRATTTLPTPRAAPTQPSLPLSSPPAAQVSPPAIAPNGPPPAPGLDAARPAQTVALSADALLSLVREAIPRIGADGRFGPEKVFVSALWHRIERDGRLPDLSYDRFKRWLVTANRDQLLDLARADLVGAMDPKLVAESEIEHLGTTFHFVVDRRATTPDSARGLHAR